MAVAPEVLEAGAEGAEGGAEESSSPGAIWQAASRGSGHLRGAPGAVYRSVSSPSAAAATVTKIIWAVALGLIVLEIAAQATGQTWSLALGQGAQGQKPEKGAYLPLYGPGSVPTTTVTAAMPGVLPNTVGNTAPVAGSVLGFTP